MEALEAEKIGLVNRLVDSSDQLLPAALALAKQIASFPQLCLRADRMSAYALSGQHDLPVWRKALDGEFARGSAIVMKESVAGAQRFSAGQGRHGAPAAVARL